ncbi:hypothetical protein PGIGA_G00113840 [Pangasianodon gigas]|uniref:Uncharacterized protein n=1 Tax=Pangasianodon gigas TaxID=30993 RepID=A0ACC5WBM7_PANGG|nr:hypothetical protein [Pangasianodon gigas]
MDLDKRPSPDKTIINRIIKSGGRLLPGMVPFNNVPDSDQQSGEEELTVQDSIVDLMEWWLSEEPWKELENPNAEKDDAKTFTQKAENLKKAFYVFVHLLCEQGTILQDYVKELQEVADKADTEVKMGGITRATVVALGLAAAVGSVIFTRLPVRSSVAVAAVGVGFAAVGGSATIINKIHTNVESKKVETILRKYSTHIEEIERCVKFIGSNVEWMKKYDLSTLNWLPRVVQVAEDSVGVITPISKSSGLIQGFMLGMDICSSKDNSEQLKKCSETKFAKNIHMLAKQMQASLEELMKFKKVVESAGI